MPFLCIWPGLCGQSVIHIVTLPVCVPQHVQGECPGQRQFAPGRTLPKSSFCEMQMTEYLDDPMAVRDVRRGKLLRHLLADCSEALSGKELFVNHPASSLLVPHGVGAQEKHSIRPVPRVLLLLWYASVRSVRTRALLIAPSAFPTSAVRRKVYWSMRRKGTESA